MKELIKKVFNKKITTPIFIVFGVLGVFNFIVFPGLTTADTAANIVSAIFGVFTLVFLFYYIDWFMLVEPPKEEPGETELDYIPKNEVVKKKRKSGKKKAQSEFPMPPHQPIKRKPKTEK